MGGSMGYRFWRRAKIAPGVYLNFSKSGASLSLGPRGAKYTISPRGHRITVGAPGTGLFYTVKSHQARAHHAHTAGAEPTTPEVAPGDRLTMGFFKRLFTPKAEQALVDGIREIALGSEDKAYMHLVDAVRFADGAYLAGLLSLKKDRLNDARIYLKDALSQADDLGYWFHRYGVSATTSLSITEHVTAHVGADRRGVLLALVEVYQRLEDWPHAMECLKSLQALEPGDVVVKLSSAELIMEATPDNTAACKRVIKLCVGIDNQSPVHAALLLYKGRALRVLGLYSAARDTLTQALRRKKDRPEDLLRAIRYERALTYQAMGGKKRARQEFAAIYADAPDFEDVAQRLAI